MKLRWTQGEECALDRYIDAVRAGKYATVEAAAQDLYQELLGQSTSTPGSPIRTLAAVRVKLVPALRDSGVQKKRAHWSRAELRVFSRYVRALYAHRYSNVLKASADCQRELIELRRRVLSRNPSHPSPPFVHSLIAIRRRLADCTTGFAGIGQTRCLTADLTRTLDRYARGVSAGRFATVIAAAQRCSRELAQRKGPYRERLAASWLRILIIRRIAALRLTRPSRRWLSEETAVLDHYARRVLAGEYQSLTPPVHRVAAALSRLRRRNPKRYAESRPRTLSAVRDRLDQRIAALARRSRGERREIGGVRWRADEEQLIARYAQRLIARRYRSARAAGQACWQCFQRLRQRGNRSLATKARPANRTLDAVDRRLRLQAQRIARFELPFRRWSGAEKRIAARWVLRYHRHRLGELRMNLETCARMMQGDLQRRGFFRSIRACQAEINRGYRRVVRGVEAPRGGRP